MIEEVIKIDIKKYQAGLYSAITDKAINCFKSFLAHSFYLMDGSCSEDFRILKFINSIFYCHGHAFYSHK
jgi:hypothetical protein